MKILVIDDLRRMYNDDNVTYARTPDEGLKRLDSEDEWGVICLDHDMGWDETGELTIWPCMEYIETNPEKFKKSTFWVITSSPVGGDRIEAALKNLELTYYRLGWREKADLFSGG